MGDVHRIRPYQHCWLLFSRHTENVVLSEKLDDTKRTIISVDIYVTEYGTALTTILPILFLYLNTVTVTAGTFEP